MVSIKILSIRYPERYTVRRVVTIALQELLPRFPALGEIEILELHEPGQINKYAQVLILPSLVIEEKLVCSGRFPSKEEVVEWLEEAIKDKE